jgi:TldD protein
VPIAEPFEAMTPDRIHAMLRDAGELNSDPILYLEGYRGGQVNTKLGRYTFSCSAIWRFTADGYTLHRPALFSGPTLDTLSAIRRGFGPLLLDAPGTCGKRGQSVTSSGGSHYFLLLDRHPEIQLGGSDAAVAAFKAQET